MKNNLLTCLFGHHNYSRKFILDKDGNEIRLCTICKRSGLYETGLGYKRWNDYDNNGNRIHWKSTSGYEVWYINDDKGNRIHFKDNEELERWLHNSKWLDVKPLNWEYEKYVK